MVRVPSVITALLVAGMVLTGGHAGAENAPPRLDFAGSATWIGQVPILVAIDKGFYKDEGLDVRLQSVVSSSDRLRALSSGAVAFSNLGRTAAISAMAQGDRSFSYFGNVDDSPGNEGCIARPGIGSVTALRGKKVAANSSAQITLDGLLQNAGMTEKDISFVNLSPTEMLPALAHGDVDAACVWQPILASLMTAVPNGVLVGTDKDTPNYQRFHTMSAPDILVIARSLVEQHPDQAARLARATFRGADFANEHPEETASTVAHFFRLPPDQILAAMKSFEFFGSKDWKQHIEAHAKQMQYLADWLADNGKIAQHIDASAWLNTAFIEKH